MKRYGPSDDYEGRPWFYGGAYYDGDKCEFVCVLIPFNVLVRWARKTWVWLRRCG